MVYARPATRLLTHSFRGLSKPSPFWPTLPVLSLFSKILTTLLISMECLQIWELSFSVCDVQKLEKLRGTLMASDVKKQIRAQTWMIKSGTPPHSALRSSTAPDLMEPK